MPRHISDWPEQWINRFEEFRSFGPKDVEKLLDDELPERMDRLGDCRAVFPQFAAELFRDDLAEWQTRKAFGASSPLMEYEGRWLFLCGGELKALAMICAGFWATSPMTGENNFWTPEILSRLAGLRICILFDDDKEGRRFRDATISALLGSALEMRAITLGVKQNGVKLDANDVSATFGSDGLKNKIEMLLEKATPIDAEEWGATHPHTCDTGKPGTLSSDLNALDTEYAEECYAGLSRTDRNRQYENYLEQYPPAISGDGGHRTLLLAVAHRHGFGVSIHDALNCLREYNARCDPPWSANEIQRKLASAKPLAAFPPGSRLRDRLTDDEMMEVVFTPKS